jgi:hypothetical protein
VKKKLF